MAQGNTRQFLTLDEAAAMLQVSKRTLQRLIQRHKIPGLKIGGQWRVPESRFMKWVDGQMDSNSALSNGSLGESFISDSSNDDER